jgi:hypothetical protein
MPYEAHTASSVLHDNAGHATLLTAAPPHLPMMQVQCMNPKTTQDWVHHHHHHHHHHHYHHQITKLSHR